MRGGLCRGLAWFLYLGSSFPRLRGFQIYTQYERCATSLARAVASANQARQSKHVIVISRCLVSRETESVVAPWRAGVVRVKRREDDDTGECRLGNSGLFDIFPFRTISKFGKTRLTANLRV